MFPKVIFWELGRGVSELGGNVVELSLGIHLNPVQFSRSPVPLTLRGFGILSAKNILLLASSLALVSPVANAGEFVATGKVIGSTPIVETVFEPVEECRDKLVPVGANVRGNAGERVIGGILGGAAGSACGKGSGKDAAAAVGAILGGEVGAQDGELTGGELVGGAVGGVIGNQVGSGSGRTAATAAGALLGSILGDELQNGEERRRQAKGEQKYQKVRVCSYVEKEKKIITGYTVVYEYNGLEHTGVLPYRPGATVDIQVRADLIENRASQVDGN